MTVTCDACQLEYDDTYHYTYCPHETFPMLTTVVRWDGASKLCRSLEEVDDFLRIQRRTP